MANPFTVLSVAETAGDDAIKKAYLQQVREHPPERDPERFQTIRAAYEAIKTANIRRSGIPSVSKRSAPPTKPSRPIRIACATGCSDRRRRSWPTWWRPPCNPARAGA